MSWAKEKIEVNNKKKGEKWLIWKHINLITRKINLIKMIFIFDYLNISKIYSNYI
jgi:hypothetical protein